MSVSYTHLDVYKRQMLIWSDSDPMPGFLADLAPLFEREQERRHAIRVFSNRDYLRNADLFVFQNAAQRDRVLAELQAELGWAPPFAVGCGSGGWMAVMVVFVPEMPMDGAALTRCSFGAGEGGHDVVGAPAAALDGAPQPTARVMQQLVDIVAVGAQRCGHRLRRLSIQDHTREDLPLPLRPVSYTHLDVYKRQL